MKTISVSKGVGAGGTLDFGAPGLEILRAIVTGNGSTVSVVYSQDMEDGSGRQESQYAMVRVMALPTSPPQRRDVEGDCRLLDVLTIAGQPVTLQDLDRPVPGIRIVAVFVDDPT